MESWESNKLENYVPEYAWQCRACNTRQTIFKAFAAEWVIPECEECNEPMIRDYRISGVHFKGTGWGGDK